MSLSITHGFARQLPRLPIVLLGVLLLGRCLPAYSQGLRVTAALPAPYAAMVAPDTWVGVQLSQPLDAATALVLPVHAARGGGYRGGDTYVTGNSINFDPTLNFMPGDLVSVTIPASFRSTNGSAATPYVYQFTTAVTGGSGVFDAGTTLTYMQGMGSGPMGVVATDLTHDGLVDLAVANHRSGTISLFRGQNNGEFKIYSGVAIGRGAFVVTAADFNRDGLPDLCTANAVSNTVSVCLNAGSGMFNPSVELPMENFPIDIEAADIDGDADQDILCLSYDGTVRLFRNDGRGNFPTLMSSLVPVGLHPGAVAVGDLNQDGQLDFVTANSGNNTVSILLNTGTGTFVVAPPATMSIYSGEVALADVDLDGDLDLLTGGYNSIHASLNDGQGNFGPATATPIAGSSVSLAPADLNGDGAPDVLSANANDQTLSVLLNDGTGRFQASNLSVPGRPYRIIAVDVDQDDDLDMVSVDEGGNTLSVRLNQPSALPTLAVHPGTAPAGTRVTLQGADFTGATAVTFNGARAGAGTFTVTSPSTIAVTVPAKATSGRVFVTTPRGVVASATSFTVAALPTAASTKVADAVVRVFPNPAHHSVTVMLPAAGTATVRATLYNNLGQLQRQQAAEVTAAHPTFVFSTVDLSPGAYILHLHTPAGTHVKRILIE